MNKKQRKEKVQLDWGLTVDGSIPMILVSHLDEHIRTVLEQVLEGIASIGLQVIFAAPLDVSLQEFCQEWSLRYPHSVKMISLDEAQMSVFDMVILEELKESDLHDLQQKHRVPIAEKGLIETFDPVRESGNGFQFFSGNAWSLFAALIRAAETYRFPYDWENVLRSLQRSRKKTAPSR